MTRKWSRKRGPRKMPGACGTFNDVPDSTILAPEASGSASSQEDQGLVGILRPPVPVSSHTYDSSPAGPITGLRTSGLNLILAA